MNRMFIYINVQNSLSRRKPQQDEAVVQVLLGDEWFHRFATHSMKPLSDTDQQMLLSAYHPL